MTAAMENTSMPSDKWNDVTTSSPKDVTFRAYPAFDPALKTINSVIGVVGVIDNVFVIVVFVFFIKIADKVHYFYYYATTRLCDVSCTDRGNTGSRGQLTVTSSCLILLFFVHKSNVTVQFGAVC